MVVVELYRPNGHVNDRSRLDELIASSTTDQYVDHRTETEMVVGSSNLPVYEMTILSVCRDVYTAVCMFVFNSVLDADSDVYRCYVLHHLPRRP